MNKTLNILTIFILVFTGLGCSKLLDPDEPGNLVPKTVAEDPLLPFIEVNDTRLHAESFGDIQDPIVIFIHGGPGGDYRAFISEIGVENASRYPEERTIANGGLSRLQDEYYCVFYDQRGAGLSPRFDQGEVTFDLYIRDLDAIIDHFLAKKYDETGNQDEQVYLVGWSYGGTLGTGYINRHPEKVKDFACYEPGPFSKEAYDYFIENTTSVFAQIGEPWLEDFLLSHDHFSPDDHARADYQFSLGAHRANPQFHENDSSPRWRYGNFVGLEDLEEMDRDNTSNLSAFQGDFLFIAGEWVRDEYPEYPSIQQSCYPRSEFIDIPGTGHTGVWEKPAEVANAIREFFSKHSG